MTPKQKILMIRLSEKISQNFTYAQNIGIVCIQGKSEEEYENDYVKE